MNSKRMQVRSLSSGLACLAMVMVMASQGRAQQKPANVYPPEVVAGFIDVCSAEGGKEVPPETMRQICSCGIEEIQKEYTLPEFQKIDADLGAGKPMPEALTAMIQGCVYKAIESEK